MTSPKPNAGMFARKNENPSKKRFNKNVDLSRVEKESKLNSIVSSDGSTKVRKKMNVYLCTLKSGRVVEIRAENDLETGEICHKKYKEYPVLVEKKPFVRHEHLMNRPFSQNDDLRNLKRQLEKKGK